MLSICNYNMHSLAWTIGSVLTQGLLYLMTFTDNLSSFYCGIHAVGHVEQEDPWSS